MFKSLALIAVAQQGKPVEDWALDAYADKGEAANIKSRAYHMISTDLPMPKLAPLKETVKEEIKLVDNSSPTTFEYSYQDLQKLDTITVQLVPEKKGVVFKYQEYFVESKVSCDDRSAQWTMCFRCYVLELLGGSETLLHFMSV